MSDSLQPHGALQVPLSMEFSRQECWSGLPFLSSGELPDPVSNQSPASEADSLPFELSLGLAYFSEVEVESVEVDCLGLKILILLPTF